MVDAIYANADIKLRPQPIPPSNTMTTAPIFWQHFDSVKLQLSNLGITKRTIAAWRDAKRTTDKVVIYGWHKAVGSPIQPVYAGHIASYADYSHGVRLISNTAFLNGKPARIQDILQDPRYAILLSSEGVINKPFYPIK